MILPLMQQEMEKYQNFILSSFFMGQTKTSLITTISQKYYTTLNSSLIFNKKSPSN
jgi:hypothetical protein